MARHRVRARAARRRRARASRRPTTRPIGRARIALYKPWVENIDEGWTRWLLEQHEFTFAATRCRHPRRRTCGAVYDVIILPSASAESARRAGTRRRGSARVRAAVSVQPGVDALKAFVEAAARWCASIRRASWRSSVLGLPFATWRARPARSSSARDRIVRLELDAAQPLAYGMTARKRPRSSRSAPRSSRHVRRRLRDGGGRYAAKDVLSSGWLEGEEVIAGRSAVVRRRSAPAASSSSASASSIAANRSPRSACSSTRC